MLVGVDTVDLVGYDPAWPERYEAARDELLDALGDDVVLAVHHIGSTAVPGLVAKPTLDLALVVSSIDAFVTRIETVERLGYEYRPASRFHAEHLFLRRIADGERTHHLHVVTETSGDVDAWLTLRDLLRSDPQAAQRYVDVKRALARRHYDDRHAYAAAKGSIVEQLLAEARGTS